MRGSETLNNETQQVRDWLPDIMHFPAINPDAAASEIEIEDEADENRSDLDDDQDEWEDEAEAA